MQNTPAPVPLQHRRNDQRTSDRLALESERFWWHIRAEVSHEMIGAIRANGKSIDEEAKGEKKKRQADAPMVGRTIAHEQEVVEKDPGGFLHGVKERAVVLHSPS